MLVIVHSQEASNIQALPEEVLGAHTILAPSGKELFQVKATSDNKSWEFSPSTGISFRGSNMPHAIEIATNQSSVLSIMDGSSEWTVICRPNTPGDRTSKVIGFTQDIEFTIGRSADNLMVYDSQFVSSYHARISYRDGRMYVRDLDSANGVFVNGVRIRSGLEVPLSNGNIVSILGLTIVVGRGLISHNNPGNRVKVIENGSLVNYQAPRDVPIREDIDEAEEDYFYPALRFMRSIEPKDFSIDPPPQKAKPNETPLLMRIGPSMIMGLAAVMSAAVSVTYMLDRDSGRLRAIPMICMAVAMIVGSVVWPILNSRFEKRKYARDEMRRKAAYSEYLSKMKSTLLAEIELQSQILRENCVSPQECLLHAKDADSFFMSETPLHQDYLDVRLGIGDISLEANIRFPDQKFQVEEDELRDVVENFSKEPNILRSVPVAFHLIETPALGIVGSSEYTSGFIRNIIIQIASRHAYDRVKIVFFCDKADVSLWRFVSHLPHTFDDEEETRFFASSLDGANEVGMFLDRQLTAREEAAYLEARDARPYYVIVCTSKTIFDRAEFIERLLELKDNLGFSFIAAAQKMHELPKQCKSVLNIEHSSKAYLLNRDDVSGKSLQIKLDPFVELIQADHFVFDITKQKLEMGSSGTELPDTYGFMEMFDVSQVEHLNVYSRWRENSGAVSLAARIGVDQLGEPFLLNLHEKIHGPHGLIAGTTGSGKSEFIISYILSMAVNYSPDDVAFVLIDYKGGGLASAFENDRFVLPHLAGTITNLDGAAITRSLVSIKSELQRRQRLFNDAREVAGGDNVDIYKYLDMYRQGRVSEKCPHLMIIADEFAELKQQEPEFMDELISAARIGRSLGVHLILATQKPSGVVNDQIWSNARFKISLKVADAADSKEVIKTPDAAELKQPGRFYLMVGYNELYSLGQSGYSGNTYDPARRSNKKDPTVEYIGDTGRVLMSMKMPKPKSQDDSKSELVAVLEHVCEVATTHNSITRPLWLPPLATWIALEDLRAKYSLAWQDNFNLVALLGELDAPARQEQHPVCIDLSGNGSLIVYGAADAGAEMMLQTMLCSLILSHSPQTLNAYVLDFGTQSLTAFAEAPQVGDVVIFSDEERVNRFFDFIEGLIAQRRELFASYGGSFQRYCSQNSDCPAILVVINGIAAFLDTFSDLEDRLQRFLREAPSAGISIIACGETITSVRVRMRSSFRQAVCCELTDIADYTMLFGSVRDIPLPRGFGRGLVSLDEQTYLFQAASIASQDEQEFEKIAAIGKNLSQKYEDRAASIPVAPKIISPHMATKFEVLPRTIPIGVYDDNLQTAVLDFSDDPICRCVFQKKKTGSEFMDALIQTAVMLPNWNVIVLDIIELMKSKPRACLLATRKTDAASSYLKEIISKTTQSSEKSHLFIVSGISTLIKSMDSALAGEFKNYLKLLNSSDQNYFVLLDGIDTVDYHYEDWFKAHMTNKDGLWVGSGADSQSSISLNYNVKYKKGLSQDDSYGYMAEAGNARFVYLVKTQDSDREE